MFALGNAMFACDIRSTHGRSFQGLAVRRKWKRPAGAGATPTAAAGSADTPPACKSNPNLKQRPLWVLFCLKMDNSCCYARYSCGNNCNVVVKLVQEFKFFLHILLPFYGNSLPWTIRFLGKRTVTSERSWQERYRWFIAFHGVC